MGNRVAIVKPDGTSVENGGTDMPGDWDYTYYTMDASGNTIAIYQVDASDDILKLKEQNIYGSERLGTKHRTVTMDNSTISTTNFVHRLGDKEYELKNHLGNVLVTVSDMPRPKDDSGSDNVTDAFEPVVLTAQDYTPFGTIMGGSRGLNQGDARFGFQGQENDREIKGNGNSVNFSFRMHDPRLGRFFAVDPITAEYAYNTPYSFSENRLLDAIELEGKEILLVHSIRDMGNGKAKITIITDQNAINNYSSNFQLTYPDGSTFTKNDWGTKALQKAMKGFHKNNETFYKGDKKIATNHAISDTRDKLHPGQQMNDFIYSVIVDVADLVPNDYTYIVKETKGKLWADRGFTGGITDDKGNVIKAPHERTKDEYVRDFKRLGNWTDQENGYLEIFVRDDKKDMIIEAAAEAGIDTNKFIYVDQKSSENVFEMQKVIAEKVVVDPPNP